MGKIPSRGRHLSPKEGSFLSHNGDGCQLKVLRTEMDGMPGLFAPYEDLRKALGVPDSFLLVGLDDWGSEVELLLYDEKSIKVREGIYTVETGLQQSMFLPKDIFNEILFWYFSNDDFNADFFIVETGELLHQIYRDPLSVYRNKKRLYIWLAKGQRFEIGFDG